MKSRFNLIVSVLILSFGLSSTNVLAQEGRWSEDQAWEWYDKIGAIKGFNFLPSTAVNSTEMWQAATFDPKTIDKELALARGAGYNSARVFLQYLVWEDDPKGLKKRIDTFLSIAEKRGISLMFILFDDCAFASKEPYLGPQDEPVPGVHNSGWTPSPGSFRVKEESYWARLEEYVKDIISTYKEDSRVIVWDMYNEPGNSKMWRESLPLLKATFNWAREVNPTQPLTAAPWGDFYNIFSMKSLMTKEMFDMSDIITFHAYETPEKIDEKVEVVSSNYNRPMMCTEWLRRQNGGTFANILPIFAKNKVGWYQWGLVAGDTQTYMHWGSKEGSPEPDIWQHDVFYRDGRPYEVAEFELIKDFDF